jgi:hypothetical protein
MTQLTPPLLAMMASKKVRTRRAHILPPKELTLHMPVAKLLREYCKPDWIWTHFPAGEERNVRVATKLKQMGLNRGWPDFILVGPKPPHMRMLELKRVGKDLTPQQEDVRIWCIAHGVPYVVAWTMDQVLLAFEHWECLRVKFEPKRRV